MRKIFEIRERLNASNDILAIKELLFNASQFKDECVFKEEKDIFDNLIDDIEEKIFVLSQKAKASKDELSSKDNRENQEKEKRLVLDIHESENCTIIFHGQCSIREIEKEAIRIALKSFGYNRTKTAVYLGISVRTLRNKLNEYITSGEVGIYEI